jgi:hypothetical protein
MKLTIEMSSVETCDATRCAYNVNRACHARAITVGGGTHPACDTFIPADHGEHVASEMARGGVGACKVDGCKHNHNLECAAPSIVVTHHWRHADCRTYEKR